MISWRVRELVVPSSVGLDVAAKCVEKRQERDGYKLATTEEHTVSEGGSLFTRLVMFFMGEPKPMEDLKKK